MAIEALNGRGPYWRYHRYIPHVYTDSGESLYLVIHSRFRVRPLHLPLFAFALLHSASFGETIGNLAYWANPSVQSGYGGTEMALGAWNGPLNPAGYFVPAPTIGEVITVPSDHTILQSFTAVAVAAPAGFGINFTAAVYAWDTVNFRPVGNALAISELASPVLNGPTQYLNNFDSITFSPNVGLVAQQQYVILFSTLGVSQPFFYESTSFGVTPVDTYSGGQMVFASVGTLHEAATSLDAIETERWGSNGTCDALNLSSLCADLPSAYPGYVAPDLAFSANFASSIPEPSALALVGLGFVPLLINEMRRKTCKRKLQIRNLT